MFKKLLSEGGSHSGNIVNFVALLKREVRIWKLIVLALILVILFFFISGYKLAGEPITAKQIQNLKKDVIAEITFEGVVMENKEQEKMLDEIIKSEKIKGLVVIVNTPGGTPNHAEIVYLKLKTLRQKIPVIVFIKEIGASAGYMIAIAGEKIVAMKTSIIGSIGVRFGMGRFDVSELLKKYHIGYEQYSTSEYKVMGDPLTKNNEKEREYFKELLMNSLKTFTSMVAEERKLTNAELNKVANAKIFLGEQALELKLIDAIGTKELAIDMVKQELKQKGYNKELEVQEINPEPKKPEDVFGRIASSFSSVFKLFQKLFYGNKSPILSQI